MENYIQLEETEDKKINIVEPFEIEVTKKLKFNHLLRTCVKILERNHVIHIIAIGPLITKAVNLAEDMKSKFHNISQKNELFYTEYTDIWVPRFEQQGLDSLEVTRSVPSMKIILSKQKLENCVSYSEEDAMNKELIDLLRNEVKIELRKSKSQKKSV